MGNWVAATTAALLPHPTRGNPPPTGEFFGSENFKEWSLGLRVLCSGLCSNVFHAFPINEFWCTAVRRTVVHALKPGSLRRGIACFLLSRVPKPLEPRVMGQSYNPPDGGAHR
jgi:hypothetical protein